MARQPRRSRRTHPLEDPAFMRQVERLVAESRQALPSDAALAQAAEVTEADITAAMRQWDTAQAAAGTGLAGLLAAQEERV